MIGDDSYLASYGCVVEKDQVDVSEVLKLIYTGDKKNRIGAVLAFTGVVRENSLLSEKEVKAIDIEAWPERANKILEKIALEIRKDLDLVDVRIYHAHGHFKLGEVMITAFCAGSHRSETIKGIEQVIQRYKAEAPFWKKEIYLDGSSAWINR